MTAGGRARWLALTGVVALSVLLVRGAFVPAPHSGGDNATYLSLAYGLVSEGAYNEVHDPAHLPHTKYPPVFPGVLAALMLLGARSWAAFKGVSVVGTLVGVALTFLWAERRSGWLVGLGVAGLVALSAATVDYSHWILSDPLFTALTMLALWSLERSGEAETADRWLVLGVVATGLAFFTRSAGLPMVIALLGWLVLRRRWRAVAASAVAIGVPALLWALRARGEGVAQYASEFWMVDPYQPALGTVGPFGLVSRLGANVVGYVTRHGPATVVGPQLFPVALPGVLLGVLVSAAALGGWILRLRRSGIGPAEMFFPLYLGLIGLWPAVWSGDRFLLPVLPLVFFYGYVALGALGARMGRVGAALPVVAFLLLAVPALGAWFEGARGASGCAAAVRQEGPFACYGPGVGEFTEAAAWAAEGLPGGAAVLTRKPSIFFVLSGVPSRTFPFSEDPEVLRAEAEALGARYILLDAWDGLATRYVASAVVARPEAFCSLQTFGSRTYLLGLVPTGPEQDRHAGGDDHGVTLARCPASYRAPPAPSDSAERPSPSSRIPLLDRLDP